MGTAIINIIGNQGNNHQIRALCDNGSQVNLISRRISQNLGLISSISQTTFIGIGGINLESSFGEMQISIQLKNGTLITDNFFIVKTITSYTPQPDEGKINWNISKNQLSDYQYDQPGAIDALLGIGIWIQIIQAGIKRNQENQNVRK